MILGQSGEECNGSAMEQPLQRLSPDVTVTVPKLGKCRCSKRDLGERRYSLVDERLQPTQRSSLIARRIGVRQELTQ
jgi:hypothetical protein